MVADVAPGTSDSPFRVSVAPGGMEASLLVTPPEKGLSFSQELLGRALAALKQAGVTQGVDEAAVKETLEFPGTRLVVAHGQAPERGEDARLEWHVNPRPTGLPLLVEHERVDFHSLNLVQNVTKDQLLVTKVPATHGTQGMAVDGRVLEPTPGRDTPLPGGQNVYADAEGLRLFAASDGHVAIRGNRVSVLPVFEIKANVDYSTGDIQFVGTVVVRGNVTTGFTVQSDHDIEVHGYVDGGFLQAGGNVHVKSGIQGAGHGKVKAGGNVTALYIENAVVEAGGDVVVSDAIMHSRVSAGGRVAVTGNRGLIVGGLVQADQEVSAGVIGANLATATEIEVGANPALREELKSSHAALTQVERQLERATSATHMLKDLEQRGERLPAEKKEALLKLVRGTYHLMGERETLSQRVLKLEEELEERKNGRVRVTDTIHPGVKVTIGRSAYFVYDTLTHTRLVLNEAGDVVLAAL
ncbi:MAG: FapA family protein [Firmicutes bacterium]|nr:FapA family protein [Bacillota bacterium]